MSVWHWHRTIHGMSLDELTIYILRKLWIMWPYLLEFTIATTDIAREALSIRPQNCSLKFWISHVVNGTAFSGWSEPFLGHSPSRISLHIQTNQNRDGWLRTAFICLGVVKDCELETNKCLHGETRTRSSSERLDITLSSLNCFLGIPRGYWSVRPIHLMANRR